MKKLTFFLVLLFLSIRFVNGQVNKGSLNLVSKNDSTENENPLAQHIITTNLLSPFSPMFSRINLGYIHGITDHFFIGLSGGIGVDIYNNYEDYQLYDLRTELYYVFSKKSTVKSYVSFEYFYVWHHEIMRNAAYSSGGEEVEYDKVDYERSRFGFNFKTGIFVPVGERLGFDFFLGIGRATVNETFYDVEEATTYRSMPSFFSMYGSYEGIDSYFNFSTGVKLYYAF